MSYPHPPSHYPPQPPRQPPAAPRGRHLAGPSAPPPEPTRRLPGWLLPAVLGVAAVGAAAGAFLLNGDETATALAEPGPSTPLLSARRAPEMIAAPVAERRLSAELGGWVAQSPPDSCLVVEASDDTLFTHNPALPLAGASTQKLVTSTALLLQKGPDATFDTVLGAAAPVSGGAVGGDLFLVGGGDPLWATGPYAAARNGNEGTALAVDPAVLADAIVGAGVTRIDGSVVGDDSRFDAQRYHPGWRSSLYNNVGPVSALNFNDGHTQMPDGRQGPVSPDPAANAAAILTDLLRQRGVVVAGEAHSGVAPAGLTAVATVPSPPVRQIVAEMLTDSDNDTAEMAFKEVGREQAGVGSWDTGVAAVNAELAEAGIATQGISVVDGSGLSDQNRLTCQLLVDLLTHPTTGQVLVEGLAVAGETGTLHERWDGTQIENRLRAKTGTLRNVTALSGRIDPLQGGTLTFAYVTNVPDPQQLTAEQIALQNGLADILVAYPRGVDINALLPAPVG